MHDIAIGFFSDWSRKFIASMVFLLVQNEYIHKESINAAPISIYKLQVSTILLMRQ